MKRSCLSILCAYLLMWGPVCGAATPDELADIRQQLQALARRVDVLEQENVTLKSQNEALRAQIPATAPTSAPPPAPAGWASRVAVKGDVRYRHQQSDDDRQNAQRDEHLLRARVAIEARINDDIVAGIGLSTTENGNPRGANARLDGVFSRKNLYLDLGYFDWSFAEGTHAIFGKMRMPFVRPGQSLFWDNDINPEGVALTYARDSVFASAYGFWIEENVQFGNTANAQADTTDTKLYGVQIGNRFDVPGGFLTLAATYYDLAAGQGRRPFFGGSSNGNTVQGPDGVLAYDYEIVQALAEYNTQVAQVPLQVWLDVAQNRAADLDTAVAVGLMLGKLGGPGSWEAGVGYQRLDKDALFAQLVDSDFAGGVTDSRGWVFRAGYAPARNWSLTASYYMSEANVDVGVPFDFDRLLLDFNTRF